MAMTSSLATVATTPRMGPAYPLIRRCITANSLSSPPSVLCRRRGGQQRAYKAVGVVEEKAWWQGAGHDLCCEPNVFKPKHILHGCRLVNKGTSLDWCLLFTETFVFECASDNFHSINNLIYQLYFIIFILVKSLINVHRTISHVQRRLFPPLLFAFTTIYHFLCKRAFYIICESMNI